MSDTVRVFVAVQLPAPQRAALEVSVAGLREYGLSNVRWVRSEGIHLTLKFLGDIPTSQIGEATTAVRHSAAESHPFRLQLGTLGVFPNLKGARVLWCGVKGDMESLSKLQEGTESALQLLGYPRENRPFSPHLTLGRIREGGRSSDMTQLQQVLDNCVPRHRESWLVTEVSLMRTTSMPGGSRYDVVATAKLPADC